MNLWCPKEAMLLCTEKEEKLSSIKNVVVPSKIWAIKAFNKYFDAFSNEMITLVSNKCVICYMKNGH